MTIYLEFDIMFLMNLIEKWILKNKNNILNLEEENQVRSFLIDRYSHKKSLNFSYDQLKEKIKKLQFKPASSGVVFEVFSNREFNIVKLMDEDSKILESQKMNNCLSSYYSKGELYSLRKKTKSSHCNFEIIEGKLTQIKGRSNSLVKKVYLGTLFDFFEKNSVIIEDDLMEELGFFHIREDDFVVLDQNFKNYSIFNYQSKKYLFKENQITKERSFNQPSEALFCFLGVSDSCRDGFVELLKNGVSSKIKKKVLIELCKFNNFSLIKEMVKADPYVINSVILEECIKFNRLESFKFVLGELKNQIINYSDLLQLAIFSEKFNFVQFMIESKLCSFSQKELILAIKNRRKTFKIIQYMIEKTDPEILVGNLGRSLIYAIYDDVFVFNLLYKKIGHLISDSLFKEMIFLSRIHSQKEINDFLEKEKFSRKIDSNRINSILLSHFDNF